MSHDNPFQFPQDILMDYLTFYKENDYFKLVSNFPYSHVCWNLDCIGILSICLCSITMVIIKSWGHIYKCRHESFYIQERRITRNYRQCFWMALTLQNLKLGGNLEFLWYSCNILRYCSNRCIVWFFIPENCPAQANRKFPVQLYIATLFLINFKWSPPHSQKW
jgi:hypothetical protein